MNDLGLHIKGANAYEKEPVRHACVCAVVKVYKASTCMYLY